MWPFRPRAEQRSLENPRIPLSSAEAWNDVFQRWVSVAGIKVGTAEALSVPAFMCGVRFIAGTIAALPLQVFRETDQGRELAKRDPLYSIVHDVVNDDVLTSYKWRFAAMASVLTVGRSFTFIERNAARRVMNLWPLEPQKTTVVRREGRTFYEYQDTPTKKVTYGADEIIDIPFFLNPDGITHVAPVERLRDTLGLAIAMEQYASRFFQNGGVPPLAMEGPPAGEAALKRAKADIWSSIRRSNKESANVLYMPTGHKLVPVGFNPEQGQLIEARLFQLQEIARVLNLPPTFLHDLSHGTFTNTEQQDLAFVKHTLTQWLELWEQELNAKIFSRRNRSNVIEFNVDGLLRGDFTTRMNGLAQGIQNAILTPDEARELLNRPTKGGDAENLHIQGATVPLGQQLQRGTTPASPT